MRKSSRRKNLGVQRFRQQDIARDYCRCHDDPPGFEVRFINDDIGDGVFTTEKFQCGDFLLEYKGDLIKNFQEAIAKEREYADGGFGIFLYFFKYKGKNMCIDATNDIFWQGRMVNDAEKGSSLQNCIMKIVEMNGNPHLCLFASRDIELGEELRFDYGDPNLPWRKLQTKKPVVGNLSFITDKAPDFTLDENDSDRPTNIPEVTGNMPFSTDQNPRFTHDEDESDRPNNRSEVISSNETGSETVFTDDVMESSCAGSICDIDGHSKEKMCSSYLTKNKEIHLEILVSEKMPFTYDQVRDLTFTSTTNNGDRRTNIPGLSSTGNMPFSTDQNPRFTHDEDESDRPNNRSEVISSNETDARHSSYDDMVDMPSRDTNGERGDEKVDMAADQTNDFETVGDKNCSTDKDDSLLPDTYAKRVKENDEPNARHSSYDDMVDMPSRDTNGERGDEKVDMAADQTNDFETVGDKNCSTDKDDSLLPDTYAKRVKENDEPNTRHSSYDDMVDMPSRDTNGERGDEKVDMAADQTNDFETVGDKNCSTDKDDSLLPDTYAKRVKENDEPNARHSSYDDMVDMPSRDTNGERGDEKVDMAADQTNDFETVGDKNCSTDKDDSLLPDTYAKRVKENDEPNTQYWGSLVVKKRGKDTSVFPMTSTALAIGSGRSNDIIVKNALENEMLLEVNQHGQVFSRNRTKKTVKLLEDKEVLMVGMKLFQWHYPVCKDKEETSEKEDSDTFEEVDDENDPTYEQPDSDAFASETYSDNSSDVNSNNKKSPPQSNSQRQTCGGDSLTEDEDDAEKLQRFHEVKSSARDSALSHEISINDDSRFNAAFKKQMENITIPTYSKKEDGRRNYRKINHCWYCERSFTSKISDHYLNIHVKEEKVKAARILPIGSAERRKILLELENRGNFKHNVKVLEEGTGELVIARRPDVKHAKKYSAHKFLPCEYCLGYYLQASLWLHMSSCKLKPENKQPSANYVRHAQAMLSPFVNQLTEESMILESLFSSMKETNANPGIPNLCRNDNLIREFAKSLLFRLGEADEQRTKDLDNIRTKVRTLGRLLIELNENKENKLSLAQYLTPKEFFNIVGATKSLALKTNSPQIALVLGHYIKQAALLKISLGIMTNCLEDQDDGRNFQFLYQSYWNAHVSCVAKRRQKLRQLNKSAGIPSTDDLVQLKNFVQKELTKITKETSPDDKTWKWAAELVIVRIALFNKSRISEVQDLKVSDYLTLDKNDETDKDILNSLDVSEKILSKRMKVIEVRGKSTRGLRKVFLIFTPDIVDALEFLMKTRYSNSPFLFCRKSERTPLDGCEAMRDVTKACPGLKHPERIRTRKLRKYLATTSQLIEMTEAELKMVADHMGHSLNVHTDIYRLQSCLLEKTKVARVLIAMENGNIDSFQGKSLQSIEVENIPEPVSYDDAWTTEEKEDIQDIGPEMNVDHTGSTNLQESCGGQEMCSDNTAPSNETVDCTDSDAEIAESETGTSKRRKAQNRDKIKRRRWSDSENKIFRERLHTYIAEKTMPPSRVIHNVACELKERTIAQIRTKIHNIVSGKLKTY